MQSPPQCGDHTGVRCTHGCRRKGTDVYTERACRPAHYSGVCMCAQDVQQWSTTGTHAGVRTVGRHSCLQPWKYSQLIPSSVPLKHMYVAHTCVCVHAYKASAIHRVPSPAQIQAKQYHFTRARLPIAEEIPDKAGDRKRPGEGAEGGPGLKRCCWFLLALPFPSNQARVDRMPHRSPKPSR